MELRQLRYFVAVAEELHFGRAARRVHVAQPAVSEQVRKLEAELGVRLLDRAHRGVALTPAGEAMLDQGRRVLRQAEAAERAARAATARATGRFRIGYLPDGCPVALSRALMRFRTAVPGVDVVLASGPPIQTIEDLRADHLDAAVVCLPAPVAGLRATGLAGEEAVAAVPAMFPTGPVRVERLDGTPMLLLARERNPAFHDAIVAATRAAGVAPTAIDVSDAVEHALLGVVAGRGVALLPASAAATRLPGPGVRFESLAAPVPPCPVVVVTRREDASTTTTAFLRAVRAAAAARGEATAAGVGRSPTTPTTAAHAAAHATTTPRIAPGTIAG